MKKLGILLFMFVITAQGGVEDIKRFKKCYALFTSRLVEKDHPIMAQVIAGSINGTEACKQLLAKANFNASNTIPKNSNGTYDAEAQHVLRNLHFMHRSFFEVLDFNALPDMVNLNSYADNMHDTHSDAYYWTYALFKPGEKVSNIITADHSYYALRYSTNQADRMNRLIKNGKVITDFSSWNQKPTLVQQGLLVGIKEDTRSWTTTMDNTRIWPWRGVLNGKNANDHFGAGVIGSQVYMFSNFGHHGGYNLSTGGKKVYRRWSKNVLKDMLCRDLPALRVNDVINEVQPESPLFFRKSASCMRCHSSMDPMAANVRNVVTNGLSVAFRPFFAGEYPVTEPALPTILPIDEDPDFYKRPPEGRIKFRSYDGTLISKETENLAALGKAISETNDFYVCTAKKYYRKLTGIEVNLNDPGAEESQPLSTLEQKHRDRVISLGLALKTHQSLPKLLEGIINTPTFISPEKFD